MTSSVFGDLAVQRLKLEIVLKTIRKNRKKLADFGKQIILIVVFAIDIAFFRKILLDFWQNSDRTSKGCRARQTYTEVQPVRLDFMIFP